jgi:hypothetical protein
MNSLTINLDISREKNRAKDRTLGLSERKLAIERLNRIPHKDKNIYVTECLLELLSDDKIQIEHRYNFFRDNRSLHNEVQFKCHLFYFYNFNSSRFPLSLKLTSAEYLLKNGHRDEFDVRDVCVFLKRTSLDTTIDLSNRRDCDTILVRNGYDKLATTFLAELTRNIEHRQPIPEPRIENLTDTRRRILVKRRTVYEDGQNVHNTSINEGVKDIIRKLHSECGHSIKKECRITNLSEVSKRITVLSKDKSLIVKQKIRGTIDRIMIDTTLFESGVNMCDILILVWTKLKSSSSKDEMEKRLVEELEEMNALCATGHVSRLINILSGFFDDFSVRISFKEQLKNYVFNYYNKCLSRLPDSLSERIIEEMTEDTKDKKPNLLKMVEENNPIDEMRKEFPDISPDNFNEWFEWSKRNYSGL